jgi:hypothetical protein
MVPRGWEHPRDDRGRYVPLYDRDYATEAAEWDEEHAMWQKGQRRTYCGVHTWEPIPQEYKGTRYTDYAGRRPDPDEYLPQWPREECTHLQMYENTSEGTPISPVCETPEELARWLVDNEASSFGQRKATYEQWLAVAQNGWAPSMVLDGGGLRSGVEALAEAPRTTTDETPGEGEVEP